MLSAPELPATTLAAGCYGGMFYGCTGLTEAPELPATTLVDWCYGEMFSGCTNLSSVTCLAENPGSEYCDYWLSGVAASGTFTKADGVAWPSGVSGIPEGWSELTAE